MLVIQNLGFRRGSDLCKLHADYFFYNTVELCDAIAGLSVAFAGMSDVVPALFTTLCAASKIPMTMFQVFVTMRTAAAVLNDHLKNIHVSMSEAFCQDCHSNKA